MSRTRTRTRASRAPTREALGNDPLWYKDAIIYELRVGAFQDSDGDGKGDFRGLAERLDYLQDLGVTALWLLPFYPSPGRDDGYDIAEYTEVHPDAGTLEDFKHFMREAHRRGLRVITELVINHTSDQHPWFQRARRAPAGSRWRDFYVWSDSPERYAETRIIFKDFEHSNWSWDPVAHAYYWHRFYSHQPDLNFDCAEVRRAVFRFLDFWLKLGVDGLRLDAIPYLFEREGTNCENLPETHAFLRELRRHVDATYHGRMLLAEANQWPEDAVAYFGKGDECHMSFHFPVMPRLFMALHMEDRFPIIDILNQTPPIADSAQWAMFLRNHDELTLEMVTDEERDYMYRVYAHDAQARINLGIRRRLAPLLGNDRRRMELMNALLLSLPGTPVIYYGDEIGMGDNFYLGDRNGVRTPMQWSSDRNAGFSRANPQRLYLPVILDPEYHYESVNVEAQQANPHSLLSWMKRLIAMRKRYQAFGRGSIEFLHPANRKVLAFIRSWRDERILVVVNLSRFVEYAELDLPDYKGQVAVELFSRKPFPPIGELPYLLTLGPHSFYWFSLEPDASGRGVLPAQANRTLPSLRVRGDLDDLFAGDGRVALERALPEMLVSCRWFAGKALRIASARLIDSLSLGEAARDARIALVRIEYQQGDGETYAVPLRFATGAGAEQMRRDHPGALLAELELEVRGESAHGVLVDALEDETFCLALLDAVARRRQLRGAHGELVGVPSGPFRELRGSDAAALRPSLMRGQQSNSSIAFGERLVLKLFRKLAEGVNPDLEVGRFLTERARFARIPPVAGALEYRVPRREPVSLGILQGWVENEGDAWSYTTDQIERYCERVLTRPPEARQVDVPSASALELSAGPPSELAGEMIGAYLETARLLGQRTAELHHALASDTDDPAFAPEPFSSLYQRSLYQSMRNLAGRVFPLLADRRTALPEQVRAAAELVLARQPAVLGVFEALVGPRLSGQRIRTHGDYHLGQVLSTGNDFVIIDFEGEPARPLGERRLKRSPLRDVAGMLRSFDYAAHHALIAGPEAVVRPLDVASLTPWARFWSRWVCAGFLRAYLEHTAGSALLPATRPELALLLRVLELEKAIYELGYELNNRPDWAGTPLGGILGLLGESYPPSSGGGQQEVDPK